MTPANSARIWVRGNMCADRPEGPWYRIITPDETRKLLNQIKERNPYRSGT